MQTVSDQTNSRKRRVERLHDRDGFRRIRAEIVRMYFTNHRAAYLDQWQFNIEQKGSRWRILPDWRVRIHWEIFRRERLSSLSDRQIEIALQDLEALGVVCFTREGSQIVVLGSEAVARGRVA